jgi:gluconolactonase
MKTRLFIFVGVLCSFGFYSCEKNVGKYLDLLKDKKGSESNIFDPTGLVSASQHGKLDTIQKGFKFTEGPAVDKQGIYFLQTSPMIKFTGGMRQVVT